MKRIMFLLLTADLMEYDQISESGINLFFHLDEYDVQHFTAAEEELQLYSAGNAANVQVLDLPEDLNLRDYYHRI